MNTTNDTIPACHAGVDEAGRGPLAGPVVTAAVIPGQQLDLSGIRDSKKLTEKRRNEWFTRILEQAAAHCIVVVSPAEIDEMNILQATLDGMRRAVEGLNITPELVLVDGNKAPKIELPVQTVVGGDDIHAAISAASVLAKVTRDRLMVALDGEYPQYGFAKHKGYPTPQHLKALREHGATPHHRQSFGPVKQLPLI